MVGLDDMASLPSVSDDFSALGHYQITKEESPCRIGSVRIPSLSLSLPWRLRRSMQCVLAGVCILGCLWLSLPHLRSPAILRPVMVCNAAINLLALLSLGLRMLHRPEERLGWGFWGLASLGAIGVNLFLGWTRPDPRIQEAISPLYFPISLGLAGLQMAAILAWPWRHEIRTHRLQDALGSLLFAVSLFLLFWVLGIWQPGVPREATVPVLIFSRSTRIALVGGVAMYFLVGDTRRLQGPLGWLLAAVLVGHGGSLLTILRLQEGTLDTVLPWVGFPLVFPAVLGFVALADRPVESTEAHPAHPGLTGLLMHLPLALVAVLLGLLVVQQKTFLLGPLLVFMGITALAVLRQHLLVLEIQRTSLQLMESEASLRERTADLEQSNEALRRAHEEKDHLFGVVSHDLRNPLGGIILAAELLQDETDQGACHALASRIKQEGLAMSGLLGRFLDLSAMEAGRFKPTLERVILGDLLVEVTQRNRRLAERKSTHLKLASEGLPEVCWTDSKCLVAILDNLLSNAVKFSPTGSTVNFHASVLEGRLQLIVQDQGPGFTEEDRTRLFGRFARLSARPTGGEKSTGLGLSIVKHLVEALGGRIEAESAPGQGATFRVELPLVEEGQPEGWTGH